MSGENHEQGQKGLMGMRRYTPPPPVEQRALDQWMQHALKSQYAEVAQEPIPDELLALVQQFPQH